MLLSKQKKINQADKSFLFLSTIILWIIIFIIYYSLQFVISIRYFLPIYPFFAIFTGLGISWLINKAPDKHFSTGLIMIALMIWPTMFISIYLTPHSRIQASYWIYEHIPANSVILSEHWDDALPLHLSEYQYTYQIQQLPVFGQDNIQKWIEMDSLLDQADYYILSSNRAWGSIMRVPDRYPQMSRFYQDLFDGKSEFQLVAEFNSYPSLNYFNLPISFNDSWSEEAFTVYDHPEVKIFKKSVKPH